jgi:hypothetical protein
VEPTLERYWPLSGRAVEGILVWQQGLTPKKTSKGRTKLMPWEEGQSGTKRSAEDVAWLGGS